MILAPLPNPSLRLTVRRAALPEEDVFHRMGDVRVGLAFGFPRLLLCLAEDQERLRGELGSLLDRLPVLALTPPTLRGWDLAWKAEGLATTPIDDSALRLRGLIRRTALTSFWTEGLFADLTLILGRGLPAELRGFARRVMELPLLYPSLESLHGITGLSGGALKARFRRRDLPSPAKYLRWFRLLAAARALSDPECTTLAISHRLGFSSDGNFCRWVQAVSGFTPSALRPSTGRMMLLNRLVEECFPAGTVESWGSLGGMFLRSVA